LYPEDGGVKVDEIFDNSDDVTALSHLINAVQLMMMMLVRPGSTKNVRTKYRRQIGRVHLVTRHLSTIATHGTVHSQSVTI